MGLHIDFLAAGLIRDISHPAGHQAKSAHVPGTPRQRKNEALVLLRCWLSDAYYDVGGVG